jgi:hypothetical protein
MHTQENVEDAPFNEDERSTIGDRRFLRRLQRRTDEINGHAANQPTTQTQTAASSDGRRSATRSTAFERCQQIYARERGS